MSRSLQMLTASFRPVEFSSTNSPPRGTEAPIVCNSALRSTMAPDKGFELSFARLLKLVDSFIILPPGDFVCAYPVW